MKTKRNILKAISSLLCIFTLGLSVVNCSSDDNNEFNSEKILGKWYVHKDIINGNEEDIEFSCSVKKDFSEFQKNGILVSVSYDEMCERDEHESGNWELTNNNTLKIKHIKKNIELPNGDETDINAEIIFNVVKLTGNELVLEFKQLLHNGKEVIFDAIEDEDGENEEKTVSDTRTIYLRKL